MTDGFPDDPTASVSLRTTFIKHFPNTRHQEQDPEELLQGLRVHGGANPGKYRRSQGTRRHGPGQLPDIQNRMEGGSDEEKEWYLPSAPYSLWTS